MRSNSSSNDRRIRFRTTLHNTVYDVMSSREGWEETDSELDWDLFWSDVAWMREVFDNVRLDDTQRVNHFKNHYELTRKDMLSKNIKRIRRQLEREGKSEQALQYNIVPSTFILPLEYAMFVEEFKKHPGTVWIMKPVGRAQGRGIFLFTKLNQISEWKKDTRWKADQPQAEHYVVQRYLGNPYLVGGKKFDLRLYVLVASYSPLVVYVYRGGFARFTQSRFSMEKSDISKQHVHLTNVAVQKTADVYDARNGKWALRNLKLFLISRHGLEKVNKLFLDIQETLLRSLFAVQKTIIQDKHCFELYGYDVMIDSDLKPWLIEVNASPSLTADTKDDYELKWGLLQDTFTIVDMERKLQGTETQVGGFDLVYNNKRVVDANGNQVCYLGTYNNRDANLREIFRKAAANQGAGSTREKLDGSLKRSQVHSPKPERRIRPARL
eukprot:GCRY01003181.1.p1 GENE.GCRY01003181.1~~GCRY01003181.1.p1  ORF type:complete len:439 (-),score=70.47 GCRY01003181.1:32-1348(-)